MNVWFPNINGISDILTLSSGFSAPQKYNARAIQPTVMSIMAQPPKSLKTPHLRTEPEIVLTRSVWLHRRLAHTHIGT